MGDDPSSARADRPDQAPADDLASRIPWSRSLLLLAVAGPALWLGGVKPWVIPAFALVVAALLVRRSWGTRATLHVPAFWWLGLMLAGVTLLQWVPLPDAVLGAVAPGLQASVAEATAGTQLDGWHRISVIPGQTGLEFARVLALTGLFIAAAQLSWRLVAAYVAMTGTVVAVIGLVHKLAGASAIYGIYVPRQELHALGQSLGSALLTSFVNPNHQSGLLLLGVFAAAAMAMDLGARAEASRNRRASQGFADRGYLAWGSLAIQVTALVLSMSRGAMLAGAIVTPLALVLILRKPRMASREPKQAGLRRLGLLVVIVSMVVLALAQGASAQLATLSDGESFRAKVRVAIDGWALIDLSPILGIGRGCFVDLFPLVDSEPGAVLYTHLESTPIAFVVEWGVAGAVFVLGVGYWWWRSFRSHVGIGRRLGLCGLLALAIQSGADFSLDYLGVAAPAVALAGALGARPEISSRAQWSGRPVLIAAALGLVLAEAVAILSIPGSWSLRRARDQALLAGEGSASAALQTSPLDPFVHLALAREHAVAGDWEAAQQRAEVATRLRPASLDAHLLAAVAAAELGAPLRAIEQIQAGLETLREPVPPELVPWLLARFPDPDQLSAVAPDSPIAWAVFTKAVAELAPAHARALAAARSRSFPDEPMPARIQTQLALASRNYGLALHHARLLVALEPTVTSAIKLRVEARIGLGTPDQLRAAIVELEASRETRGLDDPATVDELLVLTLLRVGDAKALAQAEALLDGLLATRAKPEAKRRRQALADQVRAKLQPSP